MTSGGASYIIVTVYIIGEVLGLFPGRAFGERRKDIPVLKNVRWVFGTLAVYLCVLAAASPVYSLPENGPKGKWDEYKSPHFIIYYQSGVTKQYAGGFAKKCEKYYQVITERLRFNRFDFWLWEDRARIYIYKDKKEYLRGTGRAAWSGASVHVESKFISTFRRREDFMDTVLPHELAHIILREFIGRKCKAPLWFDEGVAAANEKGRHERYLSLAGGFIDKGRYVPVPDIEDMKPGEIKDPGVFYATAASLVIFLLDDHGKGYFAEFCKELRDGSKFYEAMDKVYKIRDAEDLNTKFLEFMKTVDRGGIAKRDGPGVKW